MLILKNKYKNKAGPQYQLDLGTCMLLLYSLPHLYLFLHVGFILLAHRRLTLSMEKVTPENFQALQLTDFANFLGPKSKNFKKKVGYHWLRLNKVPYPRPVRKPGTKIGQLGSDGYLDKTMAGSRKKYKSPHGTCVDELERRENSSQKGMLGQRKLK